MPKTGLYIFLFTLIFAPLAFGSVELWSQATNTVLICLAVLAVFWEAQKKESNWYTVPALFPLILLLGYMLFQLLPLPPFLLKLLSPQGFTVYSVTTSAGDSTWHPLTLSPKATLKEFFRFATYVLCYVAAIQILSRYQSLKKVLLTLCFLAGAIAFEGIIQKYGSPDKIYWFRTTLDNSTMTGPWVYHNHFAGFMEMLLPICLALFLFYRPSFSYDLPLREKIVSVFTLPKANMHIILGLSGILIYVSIFVSLSRGGIISSTLSLLFFLFLLTRNRGESSHSTKGKYILFFLLVSVAGITWFGWEPIFSRFDLFANASGEIQESRFTVWRDSWQIIKDFPLFGSGFGSIITTYPAYRTVPGNFIYDHAHNDYIEILTDGGLVGFVLIALFLVVLFRDTIRVLAERRDHFAILLTFGSMSGIAALLFHSVTDFNMHNGANGLYFFLLCGIMVSASHTRRQSQTRETLLSPSHGRHRNWGALAALLLLVIGTTYNLGVARGKYLYNQISTLYLNKNIPQEKLREIRKTAQAAVTANPLEGEYWFSLANIQAFSNDFPAAQHNYKRAIMLAPMNGKFLGQYALYTSPVDPERAKNLLLAATQYAPDDPVPMRAYGSWLLAGGKKEEALAYFKKAIAMEPAETKTYFAVAMGHGLKSKELSGLLPDRVQAHQAYGDILMELGNTEEALSTYKNSLRYIENEAKVHLGLFSKVFWILRKHKQTEDALAVAQKGAALMPKNSYIRTMTGLAYQELGIYYRAKEEYQQALLLDPGNTGARKHLAQLNNMLQK